MSARRFRIAGWIAATLLLGVAQLGSAQAPAGELTASFPVTLAPSWFDPSTAPPQIAPFGVLYAVHDALVRPLPGQKMGPSLAESWTESPCRFVSQRPGIEVALEAFPDYWRHAPYVERLTMKSVPDSTTRLAMLKKGETDFALFLDGTDAEEVKRDPRLADNTMNVIPMYPFPAYEDMRLKNP